MIQQALDEALLYSRGYLHTGSVATYIPELSKANPEHLGACIMTTQGECFHAGEWQQGFTMQSVAKTISLILALQLVGEEKVFSKVGMEPSGDAFNSIVKLETKTSVPLNPMINAGAISVAGCCIGSVDDAHAAFLELTRKLCGNLGIEMDESVYRSEASTGMRNRAMAYLLQGADVLECNAAEAVDLYFKICSTVGNARDLAHYGMVLANNGINPLTGKIVVEPWIVRILKTLMLTCGMYDASGEFACRVGLPAKSGVGGGIMACAENKMGLATFGPSLDSCGNSVGGYLIMEQLSQKLGLHMFSGSVYYKDPTNK